MTGLTLTVAHNIFLDKKQRYDLFNGKIQEVIGVSIPVWYYNNKTSEPANEVFCKYKLIPTDNKIYINNIANRYEIQLPKKNFNPIDNKQNPITLQNILDLKDGGMEWLAFRQFGKIERKNKKIINVIHFIEIKTMEEILTSLA